ncbi:SPOSA6832_03235 [Sporobolomyces salmonicolor]|uniref:SPOSA6832_03235-mRNA-1:cds n=1 Tax=Sporidiobolus salmonicolor TaxID=5005 RepID=A0A0D6END9_SPOSA|nr:SPOSA6832_03235 [Sporobolomyces salmonicolor]
MSISPPPLSPSSPTGSPSSPSSPHYLAAQSLSDSDHRFPPSSPPQGPAPTLPVPPVAPVSRARSGSRTYSEVQAEEKELERRRTKSRERGDPEPQHDHGHDGSPQGEDGLSIGELRAEMETLFSLRRRSMSQPLTVDPDLPPTAPPTSAPPASAIRPKLSLTITPPGHEIPGGGLSPTAPSPAETGTLVRRKSSTSGRLPSEHPLPTPLPPIPSPPLPPQYANNSPTSDQSSLSATSQIPSQDLFWLPASLHPELAPQEFKAFIREQTRPDALARRTSLGHSASVSGGRPGRRVSMLRGEYKPRKDDGVGEGGLGGGGVGTAQLRRTASSGGAGAGSRRSMSGSTLNFEELTIKDLQRLEELAAKAESEGATEGEGEGERLGRVLRRSLSLNPHRMAAAGGAQLPGVLDPSLDPSAHLSSASWDADDADAADSDAPIIIPPPGQILRRNARTKIRKTGPGGEILGGRGGSRFGSRRTRSTGGESVGVTSPVLGGQEDDAGGDVSFESVESDDHYRAGVAPPVRQASEGESLEGSSPPSSDNQHADVQHIEVAPIPPPAVPHLVADEPAPPIVESPVTSPSLEGAPPVALPVSASHPAVISPASAEYDWASQHLPRQSNPPPPPLPLPPQQPSYNIHPAAQTSQREPFSAVPPPQAVPVPLPAALERKASDSSIASSVSSKSESHKSGSAKEKKSGWARLGLGSSKDDEAKKKKGKVKEKEREREKERDKDADGSSSAHSTAEEKPNSNKEKQKDSSSLFGGLFGRRRAEYDHPLPPATTPSPPPEVHTPPPPPTASGALLPNGRYANFYRLPIHVERAIYRLSHIKLANPRRPLYEQVLISNLMFWYLGLIQKPQPPPPAAQPVPVPGLRHQHASPSTSGTAPVEEQQYPAAKEPSHKRVGLSKPANDPRRGARAAEMPVKQPSYEVQNQQLEQERYHQQQQQHHQPSQHHQQQPTTHQYHHHVPPQQSAPSPSSSSSSSLHLQPQSTTPTHQHSAYTPHPQPATPCSSKTPFFSGAPLSPPAEASNGDLKARSPDRASAPAAIYTARSSSNSHVPTATADDDADDDRPLASQTQQREPYPPHRPTPVTSYPKHDIGFEVTSRSYGGSGGGSSNRSSLDLKRVSIMSDKSFDASEIYEAYGAPNGGASPPMGSTLEIPPSSTAAPPLAPQQQKPASALAPIEKPANALLGTVAPRGSSLRALSDPSAGGVKKGRHPVVTPVGAADGGRGGTSEYR